MTFAEFEASCVIGYGAVMVDQNDEILAVWGQDLQVGDVTLSPGLTRAQILTQLGSWTR
jgi:hypothetical protein